MGIAPMRENSVGRLRSHAQYEHVLAGVVFVRNAYFALHYCQQMLSTEKTHDDVRLVDKTDIQHIRFGLIIPKRWAKRAVTRSLIKRQCRLNFIQMAGVLPAGDWVIRLRRAIDPQRWPSAASSALKEYVNKELRQVFLLAGRKAIENKAQRPNNQLLSFNRE